jgi:hypothetical protein
MATDPKTSETTLFDLVEKTKLKQQTCGSYGGVPEFCRQDNRIPEIKCRICRTTQRILTYKGWDPILERNFWYLDRNEDFLYNTMGSDWICISCAIVHRESYIPDETAEWHQFNPTINRMVCWNMTIPFPLKSIDIGNNEVLVPSFTRHDIFFPYLTDGTKYNRWVRFFNRAMASLSQDELPFVNSVDKLNERYLPGEGYPHAYDTIYLRYLIIKQHALNNNTGFYTWNASNKGILSYTDKAHMMLEQLEDYHLDEQVAIINTVCNDTVVPYTVQEWMRYCFFHHPDYDMKSMYVGKQIHDPIFFGKIELDHQAKDYFINVKGQSYIPSRFQKINRNPNPLVEVREDLQEIAAHNKEYADIIHVDARIPKKWRVSHLRKEVSVRMEERAVMHSAKNEPQTLFFYQLITKDFVFNFPLGYSPTMLGKFSWKKTGIRYTEDDKVETAQMSLTLNLDFIIRDTGTQCSMKNVYQKNQPMPIDGIYVPNIGKEFSGKEKVHKLSIGEAVKFYSHGAEPSIFYAGAESNVMFWLRNIGDLGLKPWRDNGHLINEPDPISFFN